MNSPDSREVAIRDTGVPFIRWHSQESKGNFVVQSLCNAFLARSSPPFILDTEGTEVSSSHGGRLPRKPETAKDPVGSIGGRDFSSEQSFSQAVHLRS